MVKRASRPRPHTFASDSVAFWPRSVGVAFAEPLSSSQPSQPHRAQPPAPGTSRQRKRQARNVARAWQGDSRTRFSLESTKCTQIAPLRGAFPFIILSNARENTIFPCTLALLAQRFPAGIGTFPGGVAQTPIKTAKIMLRVHAGLYRARQASGIDTLLAGGDILASCPGMAMGAAEVEIAKALCKPCSTLLPGRHVVGQSRVNSPT